MHQQSIHHIYRHAQMQYKATHCTEHILASNRLCRGDWGGGDHHLVQEWPSDGWLYPRGIIHTICLVLSFLSQVDFPSIITRVLLLPKLTTMMQTPSVIPMTRNRPSSNTTRKMASSCWLSCICINTPNTTLPAMNTTTEQSDIPHPSNLYGG